MATSFTLPTVTVRPTETITLLNIDSSCSEDAVKSLTAFMVSMLQTESPTQVHTLEVCMAVFTLVIPDLLSLFSQCTSVKVNTLHVHEPDIVAFVTGDVDSPSKLHRFGQSLRGNPESLAVTHEDGLHAAAASILMAIGKQSGSGPEAAGVKSRPKALINRFSIPEEAQELLPGRSMGPSAKSLDSIYNTFATYTEPRSVLVKFFLAVGRQSLHLPRGLEIIMTNFRLMRGAGMTHVEAINKLMNMHPWTVRVPQLAPYYAKYADECIKFSAIPIEVREYHRLLVPQSQFMFLTPDYRPLIAVAGDYVKDVESNFKDYVYGEAEYAQLIADVRSYEPGNSSFVGSGSLAARLGIQDMTLPPKKASAAVPTQIA